MDKWTAAPRLTTSPQAQQQQKPSIHLVHKPVNYIATKITRPQKQRIRAGLDRHQHKMTYDKRKKDEFYEIFPQYAWEGVAFSITYCNDEHEIIVSSNRNSSVIELTTSPSVARHFRSLKLAYRRFSETEDEESYLPKLRINFAFRDYMKKSAESQYEPALFVPAARSFYATLRDEIFSILALDEKIDHIILKFGEFYEATKKRIWRSENYRRYIASPQFTKIVKGTYEREGGQDWLRMEHGRIELSRASSGQQEALPLLLSILYFPRVGRTLIIEEPEAHLFPQAQVEVLDFMVRRLRGRGGNIMFTTHSPYLLSSLNNHLLAYEKGEKNGISRDKVKAYAIVNGNSKSLVDKELGLISAEYIDSVPERISDRFDELF